MITPTILLGRNEWNARMLRKKNKSNKSVCMNVDKYSPFSYLIVYFTHRNWLVHMGAF